MDDHRRPRRAPAHLRGVLPAAGRRSGAPLRRQVAHAGVAGPDPRTTGSRPAVVRAVREVRRQLRQGRRERLARARLLLRQQPAGARPGDGAPAADAALDRRCRNDLARRRRQHRRHLRRQAAYRGRPDGDGLRPLRHLGARLLAGLDGSLHLLEEARAHRRHGLRTDHRGSGRVRVAHDPAVVCALAAVCRDLRTDDAKQPLGDARQRTTFAPRGPRGSPSAPSSSSTPCGRA